MSALAVDRPTKQRSGDRRVFPVAAATIIYAGAMVAVNAAGNAVPVTVSTTLKGVGRAERRIDNSLGVAAALTVDVMAGIFLYDNSASADLLTQADIGSDVYGVDDHTVAKTSGSATRSVVGKVFDVDALGVWVKFS